ncbi:DUF3574 domain-containing protein [Tardiphaga sp. 839_C3_N1_4]|uniref:DUF3574 domain-containing protein n=1 Tax=Tardiphaga sp. 839_C3_N1_4 TaxID=3240761 RepID=UPI003F226C38
MPRHIRQLFSACVATLTISVLMSGCASLPPSCLLPSRMMVSVEMIFGRNIGDRPGISESAFANFVAREITPRFPDGLTVIDGDGQWRDGVRNVDVRERAKVVLITFADDAQKRADLVAIAESYKRQFSQQSVLTKVGNACVSF